MTINKEIQDKTMTLKLAGRLDTTTSPELEEELKASLDGIEDLYISAFPFKVIRAVGKGKTPAVGYRFFRHTYYKINRPFRGGSPK